MKIARCTDGGAPFWAWIDLPREQATPIVGAIGEWAPALTARLADAMKNGIGAGPGTGTGTGDGGSGSDGDGDSDSDGKRTGTGKGRSGVGPEALPLAGSPRPLASLRLLPPVQKTNRVVVAGANYQKHLAADFGLKTHHQPIAFLKAYGALIGAHDAIRYPPLTTELDHEVELVVVVGATCIDRADPLSSVLGYTVGNDVSARDLQRSGPPGVGMDLFAAKSQDRSTGLGPWIVTRDEFPEGSPQRRLTLTVNGEMRQDASTAEMTWDVPFVLRFVDERSAFECGDVMFTGSPAGTGQGSGKFLKVGDVVEASVDGIGTLRNVVVAAD